MIRVYVAWDSEDARRFLKHLKSHGVTGQLIEDRSYPGRHEVIRDVEGSPEVWISDPALQARAMELVESFEQLRISPAKPGSIEASGDDAPQNLDTPDRIS